MVLHPGTKPLDFLLEIAQFVLRVRAHVGHFAGQGNKLRFKMPNLGHLILVQLLPGGGFIHA